MIDKHFINITAAINRMNKLYLKLFKDIFNNIVFKVVSIDDDYICISGVYNFNEGDMNAVALENMEFFIEESDILDQFIIDEFKCKPDDYEISLDTCERNIDFSIYCNDFNHYFKYVSEKYIISDPDSNIYNYKNKIKQTIDEMNKLLYSMDISL